MEQGRSKDKCPPFNLSAPGGVQRGEGWAAPRPGPRQDKGRGAGKLPSCSCRPRLSWNQLQAPKGPCPLPGLGAVSVSILISQGVSWNQRSFWCKLPLKLKELDFRLSLETTNWVCILGLQGMAQTQGRTQTWHLA